MRLRSARIVETLREESESRVEHAIETRQLRKTFDDIVAVDSLDLGIRRGTLYGMIGPNGSGKTTTIKMLVGLSKPDSGDAEVLGERIPLKTRITDIGYMPQEMAIYTDLTVSENLQLFGSIYDANKENILKRQDELLSMVDLIDRGDSLASQLSGGMKHRVSLACAMMHDPQVLFLDEPTVGVDPELRMGFWKYFDDLKARGRTVVITTHYMDEAVRCDVVGMMRQGKLIAEGSPRDLMNRTKTNNLEDAFLAFAKEVAI